MKTLDGGRIGIAAQALGIAQAALDESIKYSKERVQFGQPIGKFQAIQWMIANMAMEVEASRFLVYRAAWCTTRGCLTALKQPWQNCSPRGRLPVKPTARYSFMGVSVTSEGTKVERLYRDAKITEIYEGTSEVMRMVIAGGTAPLAWEA